MRELHPLLQKEAEKLYKLNAESLKIKGFVNRRAFLMHHLECKSDHIEQCGWFYEIKDGIHDWSQPSHQKWARKALE